MHHISVLSGSRCRMSNIFIWKGTAIKLTWLNFMFASIAARKDGSKWEDELFEESYGTKMLA